MRQNNHLIKVRAMKHKIGLVLVLGVVVALGLSSYVYAGSDSVPSAQFLAAALENQEKSVGASLSAELLTYPLGTVAKGSPWFETSYIRVPSAIWMEQNSGVFGSNDIADRVTKERIQESYNRESKTYRSLTTTLPSGEQSARIATEASSGYVSDFPKLDPVLFPIGKKNLREQLTGAGVADKMEEIDGQSCWKVEIAGQSNLISAESGHKVSEKWTVWLDPAIGFSPRRIVREQLDEEGGSGNRTTIHEFSGYREIGGGVWFPSKHVLIIDKEHNIGWITEVRSVTAGKQMDMAELDVKIPSKTKVLKLPESAYIEMP